VRGICRMRSINPYSRADLAVKYLWKDQFIDLMPSKTMSIHAVLQNYTTTQSRPMAPWLVRIHAKDPCCLHEEEEPKVFYLFRLKSC
jgi:hypothetical protein